MFRLKLLALAGIVILVAALSPSAPVEEIQSVQQEREIVRVAASLQVVTEETPERGFTFDSAKPTAETLSLQGSIMVKSVRSVAKGPVIVTLANVTIFQNLAAIGGPDTSVVGHVLADMVVKNTGRDSIAYAKFDVLVLLDEFRVSDEQIIVKNLQPGEKVVVHSPTTVFASDIPQRLKEGFTFMMKTCDVLQFSVRLANLDVADY